MQLVTFSPWFILPGCQPNFASIYLLDANNDWVSVRLRARFPKRLFGAGINYLSWLHTTNLPQPNHPVMEITFDNSPLLGVPEVNIATDHPRKGITTLPYAGEDLFICVKRLLAKHVETGKGGGLFHIFICFSLCCLFIFSLTGLFVFCKVLGLLKTNSLNSYEACLL